VFLTPFDRANGSVDIHGFRCGKEVTCIPRKDSACSRPFPLKNLKRVGQSNRKLILYPFTFGILPRIGKTLRRDLVLLPVGVNSIHVHLPFGNACLTPAFGFLASAIGSNVHRPHSPFQTLWNPSGDGLFGFPSLSGNNFLSSVFSSRVILDTWIEFHQSRRWGSHVDVCRTVS
jgi:hypothetical protein